MDIKPYHRKINYYETDKMGITHHSNYIRFMEEARIDFLDQFGWGFDRLESIGLISPVLGVNCKYKETTAFHDEICIYVSVQEFKGVKFTMAYKMISTKTGHEVCTGTTEHCFLNAEFKPVRLKKEQPEFYQLLSDLAMESQNQ